MARRSVMFTPGDRSEMLRKAQNTGADVLVFDLEDAVAPGKKAQARETVAGVLSDPDFDPDAELCVRVNPVGHGARQDIADAVAPTPEAVDSIMLPKTAEADEVRTLAESCREHDIDPIVLALIESAAGVLSAADIACVAATDALVFGAEDLAADLGATRTEEGTEVLYAREHVVTAASANDIDAIDTVYTDIEDTDGLAEAAAFAVQLGYDGKMAIHPAQVDPINDAFTPDEEQIRWATRVLDARDTAQAEERGVFRVDGEMIDAPLIAQAEQIATRARAAGLLDDA